MLYILDSFWFQLFALAVVIVGATFLGGRFAFSYRQSFNMLIDPGAFAEEGQSRQEFGMGLLLTLLGMMVFGGLISVLTNQLTGISDSVHLQRQHELLGEAFETHPELYTRRLLESVQLTARSRWHDVDMLELQLGVPRAEMTRAVSAHGDFRFRKLAGSGALVLEETFENRSYGARFRRDGGLLVVSTQSATDPAVGHFARTLAENLDASFLSNERYSLSHPLRERHVRFSSGEGWLDLRPRTPRALRDFGDDLRSITAEVDGMVYLSTSNSKWTHDVHLMCGRNTAELKAGLAGGCASVPGFDQLLGTLRAKLEPEGLSVGTTEELHLDKPSHIANAVRQVRGLPVVIVFVSIDILWGADELPYYTTLAALRDGLAALPVGEPTAP